MKKICMYTLLLCGLLAAGQWLQAQGFAGFKAGKNTGVNGVFYNPASIAGSNFKWDVNLGGAHAEWGLAGSSGTDTIFTKGVKNIQTAQLVTESFKNNGYLNADVFGLSAMLSLTPQSSIALTTRYRLLGNLYDDGTRITNNEKDSLFTYTGDGFQKAAVNAWSETGLSFATVISKTSSHTISAGITAKYLRGHASIYAVTNQLSGTAFTGSQAYLTNTYGRFSAGSSEDEQGDVKGHGMGVDMGFVIERAAAPGKAQAYKYRLSVALRDVGAMTYKINRGRHLDYNFHIPANERFQLNDLEDKNFDQVKQYMDQQTNWFTNNNPGGNKYKVVLPATAAVSMDMAFAPGFFVDVNTQLSLVNRKNDYSSFLPNAASVTPRYEGNWWAVYAPASWNEYSGVNAGLSVKLGPVFIGSNSLFNGCFGKDVNDVHIGIRFGKKRR